MKRIYLILGALLAAATAATAQQPAEGVRFDEYFTGNTMRFDFQHAGDRNSEFYLFDCVKREGEWAGSTNALINPFEYGEQHFYIIDNESGKIIYKNNYCTLFNEWQTTAEAARVSRAYPEAIIFPEPKKDFTIEIYARNKKSRKMEKKYTQQIAVNDYHIIPHRPDAHEHYDIHIGGPTAHSLDIALLPDGFTATEKEQFIESCRRWSDALFSYEPFAGNKQRINIRAVWVESPQSGISEPGKGKWVNTALDCRFYTLDSERYQMTTEFQKVRDVAAAVPYESIFILTNTPKYGGGGIYNYYGLGSASNSLTAEVWVHEFGHSLMGLGDEYVEIGNTVSELYPADKEPWEANLTTFVNFHGKWENMIEKDTPVPTPFDSTMLAQPQESLTVGAYEGGGYLEKGIYRPTPQCMMNQLRDFCPVCQDAIIKYLDYICK